MKELRLFRSAYTRKPSPDHGRVFTLHPTCAGSEPTAGPGACIPLACLLLTLFSLIPAGDCRAGEILKKSPAQVMFERAANLSLHRRTREVIARRLLTQQTGALDLLIRNTNSRRSILRQVACILLGKLGDVRAESALIRAGTSPDFIAGAHARKALAGIYAKLPVNELLPRIRGRGKTGAARTLVQEAALDAVSMTYGRDAAPALPTVIEDACRDCLTSRTPAIRAGAAMALGLSGNPANSTHLLDLARNETDPSVIMGICRALAIMRPVEGADRLRPWLKHRSRPVQLETAAALYAMGDSSALSLIAKFLSADTLELRLRATTILGDLQDPAALEALGRAAADVSWRVRLEAVRGFAKLKSPGTTGVLRRLVGDTDARVRAAAAKLLQSMGVSGTVWSLIDDLKSNRIDRRIEAARALGEIREKRAISALATALHSRNLELACCAAEALANIGNKRTGGELLAALQDQRPALRYWARQALKRIYGSDPGDDPAAWNSWAEAHMIR